MSSNAASVCPVRARELFSRWARQIELSIAALVVVLGVAACASMARIEAPKISVTSVELARLDGPDAYFDVTVQLQNPNQREMAVDALDVSLAIEGERVAQAALTSPVRLPARGDATATLSARTGMDAVLRAAAAAMRRGAALSTPTLRYMIEGEALIGTSHYPFSRSGELGTRPRTTP
jgi:LEA14-like dessication related protein